MRPIPPVSQRFQNLFSLQRAVCIEFRRVVENNTAEDDLAISSREKGKPFKEKGNRVAGGIREYSEEDEKAQNGNEAFDQEKVLPWSEMAFKAEDSGCHQAPHSADNDIAEEED